jgi:hypothetical protein
MQDGQKVRLLCGECEQLFSDVEKVFAEEIFIPYHEQGVRSFTYDIWLQRFAISLVWRAVVKEDGVGFEDRPELAAQIRKAADAWGDFLLGRSDDPGTSDHHLVFWDPATMEMSGETDGLPDHLMWYILRAVDATTIMSDKTNFLYGYSKLPQMFFYSGINPQKPEGLLGTIIKKQGTIGLDQTIKNKHFVHFIQNRVRESRALMATMSDKQRQSIREKVLANPERTMNSKSHEAFLVEEEFRRSR